MPFMVLLLAGLRPGEAPVWPAHPAPSCTSDTARPWCSRVAALHANSSARATASGRVVDVHIVPHTHDDVGWLKTVDEYYYGANQSVQVASVQYIIDTVVAELAADAERRFVYVETAFFARWWDVQSEATRTLVRRLVHEGRLSFANGGWCMSDEATPLYVDMVEQQTLGLRYLQRELGVKPRVGAQWDPFGHSAFMATAYALMGMEGYAFGRIDYQDRARREARREVEVVSVPSPSLGPQAAVFAMATRHYGPPPGLNFEYFDGADPPVQDHPALRGNNVRRPSRRMRSAEHVRPGPTP